MLSGFIFPIESMPVFFQRLTTVLAPRWFMTVNRGLFLKGASLTELAQPLVALLAINVVLLTLAAKKFKTDLEP
jgi:ABC-2 type transport system permease protein